MLGPTIPRRQFTRRLSRRLFRLLSKKSRDDKGGDKEEAKELIEPKESLEMFPLFESAEVEDFKEGYLTIRDESGAFTSYDHGQETMRGDEWGFIDYPKPQYRERSASIRRLHQVKHSVAETAQSLSSIFRNAHFPAGLRSLKEKEKEEVHFEHEPAIIYGCRPNKLHLMMEKSSALTGIVNIAKRLNPLKKDNPMPCKVWDRRQQRKHYYDLVYSEMVHWTGEDIAEYNEHNLVALTAGELKRLRGTTTDTIVYSNPLYQVPPPTPTGSDAGDYLEEMTEREAFGSPEDPDPEAEHRYLHKDLRKWLAPYTGFHIAPGNCSPENFSHDANRSDYYDIPLIEKGRDPNGTLVTLVNMVDMELELANIEFNSDEDSDDSIEYDRTKNLLRPPRMQHVGQALIQYLLFKGMNINDVAKMLAPLDSTFMFDHESRWWNGYRIPQHTQITDKIVQKVLEITKMPKEWWQEEKDTRVLTKGMTIPKEQVILQMRMRERKIKYMAKKSVENYFWWRLKGEQPHKDCKSGAQMRKGEY